MNGIDHHTQMVIGGEVYTLFPKADSPGFTAMKELPVSNALDEAWSTASPEAIQAQLSRAARPPVS